MKPPDNDNEYNENENEAPSDIVKAHATRAMATTASPAALAALAALGDAAVALAAANPHGGSDPLLRMLKDGTWVYGQDSTPVADGCVLAINPLGVQHGYVAWDQNPKAKQKKLGEAMVPITAAKPDKLALRDVGGDWSDQLSMQMKCVSGEDAGLQVIFKTNSQGGSEAVVALVGRIGEKVRSGSMEVVPHVLLKHSSYPHPAYGLIYKPVFDIVGWTTFDDDGRSRPTPTQPSNDNSNGTASKAGELVRRRRRV